ncbi:precorrin-3B C(17)-methyltransferase [Orenia metallireducens]|jgi:precorrin-3B C17-methyltransferase|uniref:Precorrin-3B C(17)-methyltransferase n=2 Tax=Orenia metallireducens TaxID=1413210 RepID=A0A1C0A7A5_9FIRM|nr:precorrin-3B C(17)-methyltransferase [Orenia metallireducens]
MSLKAYRILQQVDVIVGYKTYIELLEELVTEGQRVVSNGMTKEVERCQQAINLALEGEEVAIVSSGDPGVYGMAGLILELLQEEVKLEVEIIPGITAANAAASSLGAPLMHDYAVISLSDLMTPWEVIEDRLEKTAEGDFIVALYNPKSKKRVKQIEIARDIFLRNREPNTPVGIVRKAKRGDEELIITTLVEMLEHKIDMVTTVIIGNSQTFKQDNLMVTPRGYEV